eukprot:SAG11_NODE_16797_length_537_cov_1.196347_1_plen_64_part_00
MACRALKQYVVQLEAQLQENGISLPSRGAAGVEDEGLSVDLDAPALKVTIAEVWPVPFLAAFP